MDCNFLKVLKKPMHLFEDNGGAVDLFNSWIVTGNTRYVATRLAFMRELKEQGTLKV
jgi:hypothetical protein